MTSNLIAQTTTSSSSSDTSPLPQTTTALLLTSPTTRALTTIPVHAPSPGLATIQVLHSILNPNTANLIKSTADSANALGATLSYPVVFSGYSVGRVAALPSDATAFRVGQLVFVDPYIRARDDPDVGILAGAFHGTDDKSRAFARDNYTEGTWAGYTRHPIENLWPLDEERLLGSPGQGGLGLTTQDLVFIGPLVVAYAGFRKINLLAGETVLIAPATGLYSGAAVSVAVAMGASVIAAGRSPDRLDALKARNPLIKTVVLTGTRETDMASLASAGPIDAFIDTAPPEASDTAYLGACMLSVRREGRVCLVGGRKDATLPVPYSFMVFRDITVRGSFMFEHEHMRTLVKMIERGILKLGAEGGMDVLADLPMERWEEALEVGKQSEAGRLAVISP